MFPQWVLPSQTTIAERMVETRAELPFIGDQIVCLSHDQAPEQDQGYPINVVFQLPPGAALYRTEKVVQRGIDIILGAKGVEHVAPFAGLDATTFTEASNPATVFS